MRGTGASSSLYRLLCGNLRRLFDARRLARACRSCGTWQCTASVSQQEPQEEPLQEEPAEAQPPAPKRRAGLRAGRIHRPKHSPRQSRRSFRASSRRCVRWRGSPAQACWYQKQDDVHEAPQQAADAAVVRNTHPQLQPAAAAAEARPGAGGSAGLQPLAGEARAGSGGVAALLQPALRANIARCNLGLGFGLGFIQPFSHVSLLSCLLLNNLG